MTDRLACEHLVLQIERDLAAQLSLRRLLAAVDVTLDRRRQELRTVRARLKGHSPSRPHSRTATRPGRPR